MQDFFKRFESLAPFTINGGFIAGLKTLEFVVNNEVTSLQNPTGLLVIDLTGTAGIGAIPAAILLFGSGLPGLSAFAKQGSAKLPGSTLL